MRASLSPDFVKLLRDDGTSVAYTDAETWPSIADLTGDVVYARLQRGDDALDAAYPPKTLDAWAERAKIWAKGGAPDDLPLRHGPHKRSSRRRSRATRSSISSTKGKLRAPAAAMALIERLD